MAHHAHHLASGVNPKRLSQASRGTTDPIERAIDGHSSRTIGVHHQIQGTGHGSLFVGDWEPREGLGHKARDPEEARAVAQMEKTMKWWSDCTANWREKWSKARTERNKARDEVRVLKAQLEGNSKETAILKSENTELKQRLDSALLMRLNKNLTCGHSDDSFDPLEILNNCHTLEAEPDAKSLEERLSMTQNKVNPKPASSLDEFSDVPDSVSQKMEMLQFQLDEANICLANELQEKVKLLRRFEGIQQDNNRLKLKCNRIGVSLEDIEPLPDLTNDMSNLLIDSNMTGNEAEICSQATSRRASVETQTEGDLSSLDEGPAAESILLLKQKELSDLRHAHSQLKKVLQDKCSDLATVSRRNEQHESECKRLRTKAEELRKELVLAEDEVNEATNTIRRLQKNNNHLKEEMESVQTERDHNKSREEKKEKEKWYPKVADV